MLLLSCRPIHHVYACASKSTHHCGASQGSPGSCEVPVPAVYHCCVPRWPCHTIGAIAGTAFLVCACAYSNLLAWQNQGWAQATSIMLPLLCVYHSKWSGIPQPHHQHALPHELHMWDMPQCCSHIGPADEEAYFWVPWARSSSREVITGKCAWWAFT